MLKDAIQADLKAAMLARETDKVEALRGIKSAILYEEVAAGKRESGLSDAEVMAVLKREAKKRQDAIDLYKQGGNEERATKEANEKELIESYLPESLSEDKINELIDEVIKELGLSTLSSQDMGKIIGGVKSKGGAQADGALVARLTKERIVS